MTSKYLGHWQKQIDSVAQTQGGYWHPLSMLARIVEEVGETARLLNHLYGNKPKKLTEERQELDEEIADVMYALICLANSENIDLDKALERVVTKAQTRDKDRFKNTTLKINP